MGFYPYDISYYPSLGYPIVIIIIIIIIILLILFNKKNYILLYCDSFLFSKCNISNLLGGLEDLDYFSINIGVMSSSQLTNSLTIIFQRGWVETTNQIIINDH